MIVCGREAKAEQSGLLAGNDHTEASNGILDARRQEGWSGLVRVSIRVGNGSPVFDLAVQAESIQQAVDIARARYPGTDLRVRFPIEPEQFFVKDLTARAELIEPEQPEPTAA
jgi:hypothetical protein